MLLPVLFQNAAEDRHMHCSLALPPVCSLYTLCPRCQALAKAVYPSEESASWKPKTLHTVSSFDQR